LKASGELKTDIKVYKPLNINIMDTIKSILFIEFILMLVTAFGHVYSLLTDQYFPLSVYWIMLIIGFLSVLVAKYILYPIQVWLFD